MKRGKEEVGDGKHGVEKGEVGCGKGWEGGDNASDWKLLGVKSVVPPAEVSFLLLFTSSFFCTSLTFSSIRSCFLSFSNLGDLPLVFFKRRGRERGKPNLSVSMS